MDIILQRIIDELKEQNKRQIDLTNYLGITKNSFTEWKAGRMQSYTKYIHGIAKFLNVSVEYLRGETDEKRPAANSDELLQRMRDDNINIVKIACRNGDYIEKRLTDEQVKALKLVIEQLPEAPDEL